LLFSFLHYLTRFGHEPIRLPFSENSKNVEQSIGKDDRSLSRKNFVCPGYHGREPFSRFLLAAGSTGLLLERFSKKVSSVFADCSGKKLEKKRNSLSIFLGPGRDQILKS
jgi:hypothetical protein